MQDKGVSRFLEAEALESLSHFLWEGLDVQVLQRKLELAIAALKDDLDGDQSVRSGCTAVVVGGHRGCAARVMTTTITICDSDGVSLGTMSYSICCQ